jgi:1-acyl-sn-glycerol-3-phosphate acyltransferase
MNLWVYPLLALWTAGGTIVLVPAFLLAGRLLGWETPRVVRLLVWVYGRGWLLIISPFVSFRREGFAEHPPPQPCIAVVNHRSFFDTYFMGGLPFSNCVFAVRAWPFRTLFWYTAIMRLARYLDVETLGWEATVAACRREMAGGAVMVFFPEGHRSRTGRLQRFYSGAFLAACATGTPVVPLCITGTETLLPPGRLWLQPARVRLRALPAVDPAAFPGELGHVALRKRVKELMAEALGEMGEGQAA